MSNRRLSGRERATRWVNRLLGRDEDFLLVVVEDGASVDVVHEPCQASFRLCPHELTQEMIALVMCGHDCARDAGRHYRRDA